MARKSKESSIGDLGWALPSTEEVLTLSVEELLSRMKSSLDGLSSGEAKDLEFFLFLTSLLGKRRG